MTPYLCHALLELAAQAPTAGPSTPIAAQIVTGGFSTLEIILMSTIGTLGTVILGLFKWANSIRDSSAKLLEARNDAYTTLATQAIADNKDVVHALQNVEATLARLVDRTERRNGA